MAYSQVDTCFEALTNPQDELFQRLYTAHCLAFDGRQDCCDDVDKYSAQLICAALGRRSRLLVVFPDAEPHRAALLFATALIRNWYDSRTRTTPNQDAGPVLYFGATVGVRGQLQRTTVQGAQLRLADVFVQHDVKRRAPDARPVPSGDTSAAGLPRVVTVYAPADPAAVVESSPPRWIAVDCHDTGDLPWLPALMEVARRRSIPVVAWGCNPLSDCVADFARYGYVFRWPSRHRREHAGILGTPDRVLRDNDTTSLTPVVLAGGHVDAYSAPLGDATRLLACAYRDGMGSFAHDAIAVHWKYLRSLENLAVPPDFYEAEAPRQWGLQSLQQVGAACASFRTACAQIDRELHHTLEQTASLLDQVHGGLRETDCPIWTALCSTCLDEPGDGDARLIVFPGESRRRLFLFALLSRYNISYEDLHELRIWVGSIAEFRKWMTNHPRPTSETDGGGLPVPPRTLRWKPLVVGLPSPVVTPRLHPLFLLDEVSMMLYPHQCGALAFRVREWAGRLGSDPTQAAMALCMLTGRPAMAIAPPTDQRVRIGDSTVLDVGDNTKAREPSTGPLWTPRAAADEVADLLQDDESGDGLAAEHDAGISAEPQLLPNAAALWSPEALRVTFDQGWYALFAPVDKINVVTSARGRIQFDERAVRALRVNDEVIVIHGQQRQSLYELIISRVHRHPSIELHLALIRRWQEDIRVAFERWCKTASDTQELLQFGPRDMRGLLRRMTARGSQLVSPLTLEFWLRGYVHCPLDPEDLRRVSEVLGMGFVSQQYRRIDQAARRLRGLHRGLAHRLNRWLEDHAAGNASRGDDDVIDSELGLTFGDLRNSLLILRVGAMSIAPGPFLTSRLGRIERDTPT